MKAAANSAYMYVYNSAVCYRGFSLYRRVLGGLHSCLIYLEAVLLCNDCDVGHKVTRLTQSMKVRRITCDSGPHLLCVLLAGTLGSPDHKLASAGLTVPPAPGEGKGCGGQSHVVVD